MAGNKSLFVTIMEEMHKLLIYLKLYIVYTIYRVSPNEKTLARGMMGNVIRGREILLNIQLIMQIGLSNLIPVRINLD